MFFCNKKKNSFKEKMISIQKADETHVRWLRFNYVVVFILFLNTCFSDTS